MSDDYGFYGKGFEGYGHYMTALDNDKGGGGWKPPKGEPGEGWPLWKKVLLGISIILIIVRLLL